MNNKIFFICGKTGGPFFPYIALSQNLKDYTQIYIGVRNSFEEFTTKTENKTIHFLPEVKLGILSFKKQKVSELAKNLLELILSFFLFFYSLIKSLVFLVYHNPKAVFTTGSFLAVPMVIATKIKNCLLFLGNTKIIVHQQDPLPGLSNKFAAKFANYTSCTFEYTKENFSNFKESSIIPNPILPAKYDIDRETSFAILKEHNLTIYNFIKKSKKPIFLIFGGGSGSLDINVWLEKNLNKITKKYSILHLSGVLQKQKEVEKEDYLRIKSVYKEMPAIYRLSELVLCRAGLGSITELSYMQKLAFLVPLPHSHQELNAELVKDDFVILDQKNRPQWLKEINKYYQKPPQRKFKNQKSILEDLTSYYNDLKVIIEN